MKKIVIKIGLILLFCALLTSKLWGRNPVLFVHGLASNATAFTPIAFTLIKDHWSYGGELVYNPFTNAVETGHAVLFTPPALLQAGDFYLMDFSDYQESRPSQNLSLQQQAEELQQIVQKILKLTGKPQVILVGHSMGGLAVRAYLQFLGATDVEQAIFIATPHQGSETAQLADQTVWRILDELFHAEIDPNSRAIQLLKPNSPDLLALNDFFDFPLPANTKLSCLIVEGGNLSILPPNDGDENDGLVKVQSQDLSEVDGAEAAAQQPIWRFIFSQKSELPPGLLAHSRILEDPAAIDTLLQIIDGTFPHATLANQYLGGGNSYTITLEHAPFDATVEALVWKDHHRLFSDYWPIVITTSQGQRTFVGIVPQDTADFSVQFRINGHISNCVKVLAQRDYFPQLLIQHVQQTPQEYLILAELSRAKPYANIDFAGTLAPHQPFALRNVGYTNQSGEWSNYLHFALTESAITMRANVGGNWSNPITLNFARSRSTYFSLVNPFPANFVMTGATFQTLPPLYQVGIVGRGAAATLQFSERIRYFSATIKVYANLQIFVTPWNGQETLRLTLPPAAEEQQLVLEEPAGIFQIRLQSAAAADPAWEMTDVCDATDSRPPLLLTGFNQDPLPKGPKIGGGWWYTWLYLDQPAEEIPVQIELLEFAFADENGHQYLDQIVTPAEMLRDHWFIRDFFTTPPLRCAGMLLPGTDKLWFIGPGKICQDLVYTFAASPIEPRFVQIRFFVKDAFNNYQTITASAVMLPQ